MTHIGLHHASYFLYSLYGKRVGEMLNRSGAKDLAICPSPTSDSTQVSSIQLPLLEQEEQHEKKSIGTNLTSCVES